MENQSLAIYVTEIQRRGEGDFAFTRDIHDILDTMVEKSASKVPLKEVSIPA